MFTCIGAIKLILVSIYTYYIIEVREFEKKNINTVALAHDFESEGHAYIQQVIFSILACICATKWC